MCCLLKIPLPAMTCQPSCKTACTKFQNPSGVAGGFWPRQSMLVEKFFICPGNPASTEALWQVIAPSVYRCRSLYTHWADLHLMMQIAGKILKKSNDASPRSPGFIKHQTAATLRWHYDCTCMHGETAHKFPRPSIVGIARIACMPSTWLDMIWSNQFEPLLRVLGPGSHILYGLLHICVYILYIFFFQSKYM